MILKKKLVILHGWAGDPLKWQPVAKKLEQKGREVKILTWPGFKQELTRPWNLDDYIRWLRQKTNKAVFLGHSFGGRVAIKFAVCYPELVEGLILVDAAGIQDKRLFTIIKRRLFGRLAKLGKRFNKISILRKIFYFLIGERDYYRAQGYLRQTMAKIIEEDLEPLLKKIKTPTLIIWGRDDRLTPLWMADKIKSQIPNSKLQIIKECGHSPHLESPEELIKIIKQWLS